MSNNQTYYKLGNQTLTQLEINLITRDIQIIDRDWNDPNVSITTKKYELAKYYLDQGYSRSYTILTNNLCYTISIQTFFIFVLIT